MKIIDAHLHMGDIYRGRTILKPLKRVPFGLTTINEMIGYKGALRKKPKISSRFLGDIAFRESCQRVRFCDPERYIKVFKKNDIWRGVLLPVEPSVTTDFILNVCKKHSEFIPFASVDFSKGDFIDQLKRYMEKGAKGLKIHPVLQMIRPDDSRLLKLMEEFQKYSLPAYFHAGPARLGMKWTEVETFAYPKNFPNLVKQFPRVNFIFAHMGLGFFEEIISMARAFGNVYFDTSFQPECNVSKALKRAGPEKVVFGSDFPIGSQSATLKILKYVVKDSAQLEMVLSKNIMKLIGLKDER